MIPPFVRPAEQLHTSTGYGRVGWAAPTGTDHPPLATERPAHFPVHDRTTGRAASSWPLLWLPSNSGTRPRPGSRRDRKGQKKAKEKLAAAVSRKTGESGEEQDSDKKESGEGQRSDTYHAEKKEGRRGVMSGAA